MYARRTSGPHLNRDIRTYSENAVSEEDKIRELCKRIAEAKDRDRDPAIRSLQFAIRRYLEDQSDAVVVAELLKMPDIAAVLNKKYAA
jgi:hypothetical protein